MSELQEHLANLRQFGKQMKSIVKVADALEGIVALEQHQSELQANVKSLEAEVAKFQELVNAAKLNAARANAEAEQIVASAKETAVNTVTSANAEAVTVKAEASAKAMQTIQAANDEAGRIRATVEKDIAGKKAQAAQLDSDVQNLVAERGRLEDEIAERKSVLADMKSRLAALAA